MEIPQEVVAQLIQIFMGILFTALAAGAAWLGAKVKAFIVLKTSEAQYDTLKKFGLDIVTFLMQHPVFKDWANEQKKTYALSKLLDLAQDAGIPISDEMADMIVEAAYKEAKAKFSDQLNLIGGTWLLDEEEAPEG